LLEKGDSSITTLKHLGISEYKNYYYKDSYEHLLLAYKQDTIDHEICYFLGRDCIYNEAPVEALYYLEIADTLIQPNPAVRAAIIVEMASAYTNLNKNEKAIELYAFAYSIKPRADYLFFMASLYQNRLKDNQKALEYYQLFMEELPPLYIP
jgi:tetratricopeptide (TPR) repeat protein